MRVSFYLPAQYLPSAETRRAWREGVPVKLEAEGKIATAQAWIYRTWDALTAAGEDVELTHDMPGQGIVVAMASGIPAKFKPQPGLFVAGIVADALPHPAAHVHIVQNSPHAARLRDAIFLPHWPQPGLLPRDPARGERFERIAFFGHPENIAPELKDPSWAKELARSSGASLEVRGAESWHDYRDVDAVLAVRHFRGGRELRKPATKLYNAWLAGVPFIGGEESAYAADGLPDGNYLVARSPEEVIALATKLAGSAPLRDSLVCAGRQAARNYDAEATLARWRSLIGTILPEAARRAERHSAPKRAFAEAFRRLSVSIDRRLH